MIDMLFHLFKIVYISDDNLLIGE